MIDYAPLGSEPEIQAPEVYRSTPFEHLQTANPAQMVMTCTRPVTSASQWLSKAGSVEVKPSLPSWMSRPQDSGRDRTTR